MSAHTGRWVWLVKTLSIAPFDLVLLLLSLMSRERDDSARRFSQERLLGGDTDNDEEAEMQRLDSKDASETVETPLSIVAGPAGNHEAEDDANEQTPEYRVYKQRYFGLFQLVLLNVVVSWDVSTFMPQPAS